MKELGRVDNLLEISEETQVLAKGLPAEAHDEIREIVSKHGGEVVGIDNPRSTLEELFLNIVRESQERPGHRSSGVDNSGEKG